MAWVAHQTEQSDRDGRDRAEGIGVQLTAGPQPNRIWAGWREEIASAFSLPVCRPWNSRFGQSSPVRARYADEITIPAEVVDEILRTGSNRSKSQLRLIYNFMTRQTRKVYCFRQKSMARAAMALRSAAQDMQSGSMSWVCRSPLEIRFGTTPKTKHFCPGKMSAAESISFCSRKVHFQKSVLDAARGNVIETRKAISIWNAIWQRRGRMVLPIRPSSPAWIPGTYRTTCKVD